MSTSIPDTDVLIAGGGLSGCVVARALASHGVDFQLVEARDRLGGRILSPAMDDGTAAVDLGPSWFWPHQQSLIQLIQSLGMAEHVYEQSHKGASVIEYSNGQLEQRIGAVSMAGSYRIDGGMQALVDKVADAIPVAAVRRGTRLVTISRERDVYQAGVATSGGLQKINCRRIVLALPPRLVAAGIDGPGINPSHRKALDSVSTWMATEAKLTLVYDEPFWLQTGLSGDAMSQIGPMGEIHDATPRHHPGGALFGFLLARPQQRRHRKVEIVQQAIEQVQRLFNTDRTPLKTDYRDWSSDEYTASPLDSAGARAHPATDLRQIDIGQNIYWAVSETASQDAGYLEGAVQAALRAVNQLTAG